jgi:exonuclease VII large subunit
MVFKDGSVVTGKRELREGDRARIRFHDGDVPARVEKS